MKKELLEELERLAENLPPNTLDELIDELGGPENVAEVETIVVCFLFFPAVDIYFQASFISAHLLRLFSDDRP